MKPHTAEHKHEKLKMKMVSSDEDEAETDRRLLYKDDTSDGDEDFIKLEFKDRIEEEELKELDIMYMNEDAADSPFHNE